MKRLLFVCFLYLLLTSCSDKMLMLFARHLPHYKEYDNKTAEGTLTLHQNISHWPPNVIDGGVTFLMFINIPDTTKVMIGKTYCLPRDSVLINAKFNILSVWSWDDIKVPATGKVKIKKWTSNKIRIKENLRFKRSEFIYVYRGKRTFKLTKK